MRNSSSLSSTTCVPCRQPFDFSGAWLLPHLWHLGRPRSSLLNVTCNHSRMSPDLFSAIFTALLLSIVIAWQLHAHARCCYYGILPPCTAVLWDAACVHGYEQLTHAMPHILKHHHAQAIMRDEHCAACPGVTPQSLLVLTRG